MLEIFTAALPEFVNVICCTLLPPTATFPKLTVVGLAVSCPVGVFEPVPVNGTVTVAFAGSLLTITTLPLTAPAEVGWNVSARFAL